MITGNRGEWSEIYTLFRLLGDGKVHAGDADMNPLPLYYPILNVIRQESSLYEYKPDTDQAIVIISEDGNEIARISMRRFYEESVQLLNEIRLGSKAAFSIPATEQFMNEIGCTRLKAPSRDKADIHIVIHDLRTNMTPNLGFSIKSQLGNPSTLLNAGMPTNIRMKVVGLTDDEEANQINMIEEHIPKVQNIYERGYRLEYADIEHDTFKNNLLFIDSNLPELIALCLIESSKHAGHDDVKDVVRIVAEANPFGYRGANVATYYEHKMKQLLIATALGMTPAKEWNGQFDANGGYLVVKSDGDIVCYHFYNQNDVEDYLFSNTRFERASRSRYQFGFVYPINGEYYMDLNLQIRFKK